MYKKDDVRFHREGPYGTLAPAVNIKVYNSLYPTVKAVMDKWGVEEEVAEKAVELALDSHKEQFWMYWTDKETLNDYFPGYYAKAYCAGRSGGWLEVHNLSEVVDWDAVALMRWYRFQRDVLRDVAFYTSKELLMETIEANEYYKEGSTEYNFFETPEGETVCLADARKDIRDYSEEKYGTWPFSPYPY